MTRIFAAIVATVVITAAVIQNFGCADAGSARSRAADDVYVAPGEHDKYYGFLSGGQSGSVFVVGIPSGRLIREVPVFEPRAAYGYAVHPNDPRRRQLEETGGAWGDTHHPAPSETNGIYDGKYLWINDLANGRLARVRLDGERVLFRLLEPGERITVDAKDRLSFRVGDAGAFAFTLNGTPGRPVGRNGEVREFTITRENAAAYLR